MCRLLGYFGKTPIRMNALLDHYENSLIVQSKKAQEMKFGINGDGFGLGWFDHSIDPQPALFKSIQPAWNDLNLTSLASKVRSECFIGHVRASTVGDVSRANCHPFAFGPYLFAHNGTIKDFALIKRKLMGHLLDPQFDALKGTTDSEHFFALITSLMTEETPQAAIRAFQKGISLVDRLQKEANALQAIRANILLSNGKWLVAMRYSSPDLPPLSLYFSKIQTSDPIEFLGIGPGGNGVVIASEHLTNDAPWREVPPNSFLVIDSEIKPSLIPFEPAL